MEVKSLAVSDEGRSRGRQRRPPAATVGSRESQLIAAAYDLAERQILEGKASAQVITHFLKLGTEREKLERKRLEQENLLLEAKASALASATESKELYENAIKAFRTYSGQAEDDEYED